jgi:hypothetical protein
MTLEKSRDITFAYAVSLSRKLNPYGGGGALDSISNQGR